MNSSFIPFCHPTTVVFVDDDAPFLRSVEMVFSESMVLKTYTDPEEALGYMMDLGQRPSDALSGVDLFYADRLLRRPAVAVIDYQMPAISGLELCRALEGSGIAVILLTGEMDMADAVSAFNDGLIHRYVEKGSQDTLGTVRRYVDELSSRYMQAWYDVLNLPQNWLSFSNDAELRRWLGQFVSDNSFVQWAPVTEGLLVADRDGAVSLIVISSSKMRAEMLERLRLLRAPDWVTTVISSREMIAYSPTRWLYDQSNPGIDWDAVLYPARAVLGRTDTYRCAVVENPKPYSGRLAESLEDVLLDQ